MSHNFWCGEKVQLWVIEQKELGEIMTNGDFYDEIYYGMICEEFERIDPKVTLLAP